MGGGAMHVECTSDLKETVSNCKVGDAGFFVLSPRSMSRVKPRKRLERLIDRRRGRKFEISLPGSV